MKKPEMKQLIGILALVLSTGCPTPISSNAGSSGGEKAPSGNTHSGSGSQMPSRLAVDLHVKKISCQSDRDCVLADSGCCGCSGNGKSVAVHRERAVAYEKFVKKNCGKFQACAAAYRCGELKAVCENSLCKAVSCPQGEHQLCISQTQWRSCPGVPKAHTKTKPGGGYKPGGRPKPWCSL